MRPENGISERTNVSDAYSHSSSGCYFNSVTPIHMIPYIKFQMHSRMAQQDRQDDDDDRPTDLDSTTAVLLLDDACAHVGPHGHRASNGQFGELLQASTRT